MKPHRLTTCLRYLLLGLSVSLFFSTPVRALDEGTYPMFAGTSLTADGQSYDWDQSASTDDGTWRTDVYSGSGGTLYVVGHSSEFSLATVSGAASGYVQSDTFYDGVQDSGTYSISQTFNTHLYTSQSTTTTYTVNFDTNQVDASYVNTYSGDAGTFTTTQDPSGNGSITGSESGFFYNGSMYMNENYSVTGDFGGYTQYSRNLTYNLDPYSGEVTYSGSDSYSGGPTGGSSYYSWDSYGNSSSSESGSVNDNSTTVAFTLFGNDYYLSNHSWSNSNSYDYGNYYGTSQSTYNYACENGGSLSMSSYSDNWTSYSSISGWDPNAGSFSSPYSTSLTDITWDPRTSPAFAAPQLLLNGMLMNWQSGAIDYNGVITDVYTGGLSGEMTMTLTANAHDFNHGSSPATVNLNGSDVGTCDNTGVFSVTGWTVLDGSPNQSSPLFSANSLWVDFSEYPFVYGYQDASGTRIDVYSNSSGLVTIAGNTADTTTASVWVNHNGGLNTGSVTFGPGGSFDVTGVDIEVIPPASGPDAFWAGGSFYLRTPDGNSYASFPTAGSSLTIIGADTADLSVSVTNASGTYTGPFDPAAGGVFLLTKSDGSKLPVCAALTDGTLVPSGTVPSGYPPAVQMLGSIWNYLGQAADDGAPGSTAAYYGNTRTAIFRTDPNDPLYLQPLVADTHRMLKISIPDNTDGVKTAAMTDYNDATKNTAGTYQPALRLFQVATGAAHPLALPVVGVDPQNGDIVWILHPATGSGLPATFLAHGQIWRYAGMNGDSASYLGGYTGQTMTVGAADAQGQRLVSIVDPAYQGGGTTEGVLSSERKSVRLQDGTVAFSGDDSGGQLVVQPSDDDKLQTIAADLDILGNNLSFGVMTGDASLAGALFQYADVLRSGQDTLASLTSTLSRPQAQWIWSRAADASGQSTVPVMKLDSTRKLTLYDIPASDGTQSAGVVLDPAAGGVSTIRGTLRVRPGGDISMGEFTTSPTGVDAP